MSGTLPPGWVEARFAELNSYRGRSVDPSTSPEEVFELYSVPAFPTGGPEYLAGSRIGSTKQSVRPDDVLVCKINPRINRVWKVKVAGDHSQIASSEWIVMRSLQCHPSYLRHYFSSPAFRELICEGVIGVGGSLTRAQPARVATFPVPVAPISEQKRISEKLDALVARVNSCLVRLNRVPEIIKRFRQSVLAAATSGELTREWREARGLKRDAWLQTTFDQICIEITVGFVGKMSDQYRPDGVPFLRSQNVRPFKYDPRELRYVSREFHRSISKSILHPGDVVVVRTGAPGQCCVIPPELQEANCSDLVIVRPGPELDSKFAVVFINSETSQSFVKSEQVGVAQSHFNVGSMKRAPVELPTLAEQREIARRVEELFDLATEFERRTGAAQRVVNGLGPSILSKAFRGELVPQDPNAEPAGELLARSSTSCVTPSELGADMQRHRRAPRAPKEASVMTKSRQDEDVKGKPYLEGHLRELGGPSTVEALFKASELPVADFYKQLAWEVAQGHVRDNRDTLEPGHAAG